MKYIRKKYVTKHFQLLSDSESAHVSHVTHLKVQGYIHLEMIPKEEFFWFKLLLPGFPEPFKPPPS